MFDSVAYLLTGVYIFMLELVNLGADSENLFLREPLDVDIHDDVGLF